MRNNLIVPSVMLFVKLFQFLLTVLAAKQLNQRAILEMAKDKRVYEYEFLITAHVYS